MLELYWGCLITGALLAGVIVLFGADSFLDGLFDFLSPAGSGTMSPLTLVGGIAAFGGVGVLLTRYTALSWGAALVFSAASATAFSILVHFLYVKPMSRAENSTAYSIRDLIGKVGEVSVTVPSSGFGEVMLHTGVGTVNHTAESFDRREIPLGAKVVVVDVKDGTLSVVPFDEDHLKFGR